ncbi:hypothetical protein KJ682_02745 [bacterium]|nr:hypothetical protein [bacterium]
MKGKTLKVMSPKDVDKSLKQLIGFLGLNENETTHLPFTKPGSFEPEPKNCFFNVWIQCDREGGAFYFGWILAQDRAHAFSEAQFHCIWRSPKGELLDITPREDEEERLLFIPDSGRNIELSSHNGSPALISYDNVSICKGELLTGVERIKVVPQTDMIYRYGLAERGGAP